MRGCIIASFRGCTDRGCREQPAHVLDDNELGAELVDRFGHVRPEAGSRAGSKARHLPDGGDILAGKPATEYVYGLDAGPVDRSDVAEVRGIGPVVSEDVLHGADLREPDRLRVEDVLHGEIEAAVTREQGADARWRRVGGQNLGFSHRNSG
ncbi:hypothetical protein GCM10009805_23570 [Leucobacter chromiireducens subsp. solipictus]